MKQTKNFDDIFLVKINTFNLTNLALHEKRNIKKYYKLNFLLKIYKKKEMY